MKLIMSALGLDPARFGEHSGRRGGATAASDAGVDWPDLMLHGSWRSASSPLGYLENSQRRQRRVARILSRPTVAAAPGSLNVLSGPLSPPTVTPLPYLRRIHRGLINLHAVVRDPQGVGEHRVDGANL